MRCVEIQILADVLRRRQWYRSSSSWVRRQSENTQASTLCTPDPWPFEPQISGLRHSIEDYYCAKYHVIPIRGFRFIVLTYTPTHIHTSRQSDRFIRAAVYYVVRADNRASGFVTLPVLELPDAIVAAYRSVPLRGDRETTRRLHLGGTAISGDRRCITGIRHHAWPHCVTTSRTTRSYVSPRAKAISWGNIHNNIRISVCPLFHVGYRASLSLFSVKLRMPH